MQSKFTSLDYVDGCLNECVCVWVFVLENCMQATYYTHHTSMCTCCCCAIIYVAFIVVAAPASYGHLRASFKL